MAAGNNGNVLQHGLVCGLAHATLPAASPRRLFLVDTHGMAPFEEVESDRRRPDRSRGGRFRAARARAQADALPDEHCYVTAWRRAITLEPEARELYPNTLVLLRSLRIAVDGMVAETDDAKRLALTTWIDAHAGARVRVHKGEWQQAAVESHRRRGLHARDSRAEWQPAGVPACPWLLAMDPMSFTTDVPNPDQLGELDLERVATLLHLLMATSQPGMLTAFSYGLAPDGGAFEAAVRHVAEPAGLAVVSVGGLQGLHYAVGVVAYTPSIAPAVRNAVDGFTTFFAGL